MSWLALLGFVVVVIAFVVLTKSSPSGGRPAGSTGLATAARVVLVVIALILLFLVVRGYVAA